MFGIPMVLDIIPSFIKVHTIETPKSSHPIHWEHNLGHEEFARGCELKVRITKSSTNVVSLFCQFSTVLTFFLWETNLWILSPKVRSKEEFFDPMFLRPGTWCKSTLRTSLHSGHAKMSLALHEPIENIFCSNLHTTSAHAPKTYQTWKVL